jgi:lactate dehydrogenase-like 2-hydroxyacid dehydrogenase
MSNDLPIAVIAVPVPDSMAAGLTTVCRPVFVSTAEVEGHIGGAEGLLCPAPFPITDRLLDAAPRLRVVANFGVGFNNVDLAELGRRGIAVCNTPGVLTDAVADLTIGMILAASRGLVANHHYVHDGHWSAGEPAPALGWDLSGKTLGLVGFGRIGKAVATRARSFGMEVVFHDSVASAGDGWGFCRALPLDELLAVSDVVSLHVNLTPETHHLIGASHLARMKRTAWLLNTSRGPVIDQPALVQALRRRALAGAVLDVLETEPPGRDDPVFSLDNVLVLPHIGSATVETRAAMLDLAVRNLSAVLSGKRPPECVNPEVLERALQPR